MWLISAVTSFYHYGIENKFWLGFTNCTSKLNFKENALDQILTTSPIRCDEPQFKIFEISLAGWNGLISALIFIILLYLLYDVKRKFIWIKN